MKFTVCVNEPSLTLNFDNKRSKTVADPVKRFQPPPYLGCTKPEILFSVTPIPWAYENRHA